MLFPARRPDRRRPQPRTISGHDATLPGMPRPLPCFLTEWGKFDQNPGHSPGPTRRVFVRSTAAFTMHPWSTAKLADASARQQTSEVHHGHMIRLRLYRGKGLDKYCACEDRQHAVAPQAFM